MSIEKINDEILIERAGGKAGEVTTWAFADVGAAARQAEQFAAEIAAAPAPLRAEIVAAQEQIEAANGGE